MPDFYGKSGISWAGTLFLVRLQEGEELSAFYYDGFTDDKKEDSFSALSFLEVVQSHFFVEMYPDLFPERAGDNIFYTVFLDGAGCYVSQENLMTRIAFSERINVYMKSMHIPEAYYNKTSLDGHFATAGKQMRAAVCTGQTDAYDASSMMLARTSQLATGTGATNLVVHFEPNRDCMFGVKKISSLRIKSLSERTVKWMPNTEANRVSLWRSQREYEIDKCTLHQLKTRLSAVGIQCCGSKKDLARQLKSTLVDEDPNPESSPEKLLFNSLCLRRHTGIGPGKTITYSVYA